MATPITQYKNLKTIFSPTDSINQGKTINEWHISQIINALTGFENYNISVKGLFTVRGNMLYYPDTEQTEINPNSSDKLLVLTSGNAVRPANINLFRNIDPIELNKNNFTAWNKGPGGHLSNTSFGYNTFTRNNAGVSNTVYGSYNFYNNRNGNNNTVIGTLNLYTTENSSNNTAIGVRVLSNNIEGEGNLGIGVNSLTNNIYGNNNLALGMYSMYYNEDGSNKIGIGNLTLLSNKGNNNTAIGYGSSRYDEFGNNRISIGSFSGKKTGSNWLEIHSYPDEFQSGDALILGKFDERWLQINGNFRVNPQFNPRAIPGTNIPYQLVFDIDGKAYWEDRSYSIPEIDNLLSYYVSISTLNNYYTKPQVDAKFINGSSESLTLISQPSLNGNILTIKYTGEDGLLQQQNIDLSPLLDASEIHITNASYDAALNIITITDNQGNEYKIDLSEFQLLITTNPDGTTNLTQEGVTKLILSKVAVTGSFNDLHDKPTTLAGYGITDALDTSINNQVKLGKITAKNFITQGGTSSQFVKGDGTLDSTIYISTQEVSDILEGYVTLNTEQTVSGTKHFNEISFNNAHNVNSIEFKQTASLENFKLFSRDNSLAIMYDNEIFSINGENRILIFDGDINAKKFITQGGLPTQFVKGDGSLDSTVYIPSTHVSYSITQADIDFWNSGGGNNNITGVTFNAGELTLHKLSGDIITQVPVFNQDTTGNSATTDKLKVPVNINGKSFDGSTSIVTTFWGTSRNITIGNTTKPFDGSGNVTWTLEEIGVSGSTHNHDDRYYTKTQIEDFYAGNNVINGYNKSNWDNAFSWGNHAGLYAAITHNHTIANITNLQSTLDGKVDLTSAQTITGIKNFQNGFDIDAFKYLSIGATNVNLAGAKNAFGNSINTISDSAFALGNDIFPAMNLQPFDPVTEPWNNKGYVGIGSAIFINYTGDTMYNPGHNAHDSWIGIGRALGAGFIDGTNVTMLGTTNMHRNDVKYAEYVTVVGKGFSNGIKTRPDKTLDPNRVVTASNGINVHGRMSDVIGIGHENWVEDISHSVVVGSNLRQYSYVFNSLVLGSNHTNMNYEGTQAQADMYLDSDVIIGMGVQKRSSRHPAINNLLIGMDGYYTMGTPPNPNYRPLVEGTFKNAKFQVNGVVIAGHEVANSDKPNETAVPLAVDILPEGVDFNSANNTFTFDGSQASTEFKIGEFVANTDASIYVEVGTTNHTAGTWGSTINNLVDSGNAVGSNYVSKQSFIVYNNSDFKLSAAGNFVGTIYVKYIKTDLLGTGVLANYQTKDSYENLTSEIRGGTMENGHLSFGLNSGKFLHLGTKSLIFGNNAYAKGVSSTNSVIIGHEAAQSNTLSIADVIIGAGANSNNILGTGSVVLIGTNSLKNPLQRITNTVTLGKDTLLNLQYGSYNTAIGASAGGVLLNGQSNVFVGRNAGFIKNGNNNIFVGETAGGYDLTESTINNTIVIGSGIAPEVPNNTTTIGGAANTDNFLYGTTHSHAFKVRGGTATQVMMADGSLKEQSTFGGSGGTTGDYIPLTGTEVRKPVTGFIEIDSEQLGLIYSGDLYNGNFSFVSFQKDNFNGYYNLSIGAKALNWNGYSFATWEFSSNIYVDDITEVTYSGFRIQTLNEGGISGRLGVGLFAAEDYSDIAPNNKLIYAQRSYVDRANSYSTEEIKTGGTWIDEKPIYKKYITVDIPANNSNPVGYVMTNCTIIDFEKAYLKTLESDYAYPHGKGDNSIYDWSFSKNVTNGQLLVAPKTTHTTIRTVSGVLFYTKNIN